MEPSSTSSALDQLIGTQVRLWPYLKGVYARDIVGQVWLTIERSGDHGRLWWGFQNPPLSHRMDLAAFAAFMSDPDRVVLIVTSPDSEQIFGIIWYDDIQPHRCFGSIYMIPEARGKLALEACRMGAAYAHRDLKVEQIWAMTPWAEAGRLVLESGFQRIATLPDYAELDGIRHDVHVYRKVRTAHGECV